MRRKRRNAIGRRARRKGTGWKGKQWKGKEAREGRNGNKKEEEERK